MDSGSRDSDNAVMAMACQRRDVQQTQIAYLFTLMEAEMTEKPAIQISYEDQGQRGRFVARIRNRHCISARPSPGHGCSCQSVPHRATLSLRPGAVLETPGVVRCHTEVRPM
jgi:hypothetical protein